MHTRRPQSATRPRRSRSQLRRRPTLHAAAVLAALLVLAGLTVPAGATTAGIDWTDRPTEPVALADGWTVVGCEGDAPLLCTSERGQPSGSLAWITYPLASFPELSEALDAGVGVRTALARHVAGFHETFREDRTQGCPDGYGYQPHPTVGAVVAGLEGLRYGFTVTDADGRAVEHVVTFIAVRDDGAGGAVDIVGAEELDDGACLANEFNAFTGGALLRALPNLTQLIARSTFGPGSQPAPRVVLDGRLSAEDAAGVAVALSSIAIQDGGAATVLLAREDQFADALASGGAQGLLDAPLLLTSGDALDDRVRTELLRLGARRVVILGGTAAVSADVEQELAATGLAVDRIAGADRIGTAVTMAEQLVAEVPRVVLVRADAASGDTSQATADALAAGAMAAAEGMPVLLTDAASLDPRVVAYLQSAGVVGVVLAGGHAALSADVEQALIELGLSVDRAAGLERAETATVLADRRGIPTAAYTDTVVLVDGRTWVDGLVAAMLGQRALAPVVLSDGPSLPPATQAFLATEAPRPTLLCMPSVDPVACDAAVTALNGGVPVEPS